MNQVQIAIASFLSYFKAKAQEVEQLGKTHRNNSLELEKRAQAITDTLRHEENRQRKQEQILKSHRLRLEQTHANDQRQIEGLKKRLRNTEIERDKYKNHRDFLVAILDDLEGTSDTLQTPIAEKDELDIAKNANVCPECKGLNPISEGDEYMCLYCRKRFQVDMGC